MNITLELEVLVDYKVEWVRDESGEHPSLLFESVKAFSNKVDAKLCDMVDITNLLHRDELADLEEKILTKIKNETYE